MKGFIFITLLFLFSCTAEEIVDTPINSVCHLDEVVSLNLNQSAPLVLMIDEETQAALQFTETSDPNDSRIEVTPIGPIEINNLDGFNRPAAFVRDELINEDGIWSSQESQLIYSENELETFYSFRGTKHLGIRVNDPDGDKYGWVSLELRESLNILSFSTTCENATEINAGRSSLTTVEEDNLEPMFFKASLNIRLDPDNTEAEVFLEQNMEQSLRFTIDQNENGDIQYGFIASENVEILDNTTVGSPDAMILGEVIDENNFWSTESNFILGSSTGDGNFENRGVRFLGLRVKEEKNFKYGWMSIVNSADDRTIELIDYEVNNNLNQQIDAGG